LAEALSKINGIKIINDSFFNEFVIELPIDSKVVQKKLLNKKIIGGLPLDGNRMLVTATEMTTDQDITDLVSALTGVCS